MDREQNTPCDLCGGDQWRSIAHRDRKGNPLETGICTRCGLVSHLPLPDEAQIARYYAEAYRRDYHGESVPAARRVMRAWRNGERIHHLLAPHVVSGGRVFEVGAGLGCTLKVFQHHGFRASGIEPNRDFNRYSRQSLRADVANRNLFETDAQEAHDLVLLVHVIEHFRSPTRALMKIREFIREDGLLFVECPNVTAPFATFSRLFHFAHIHNFAPETLTALAAKCGFVVERSFYGDDEPDLALLLRKTALPERLPTFDGNRSVAIEARMRRYGLWGYHLRGSYLKRRAGKLASYARERVEARAFVARLLQRCALDPEPEDAQP